jgi:hypothetical protein
VPPHPFTIIIAKKNGSPAVVLQRFIIIYHDRRDDRHLNEYSKYKIAMVCCSPFSFSGQQNRYLTDLVSYFTRTV